MEAHRALNGEHTRVLDFPGFWRLPAMLLVQETVIWVCLDGALLYPSDDRLRLPSVCMD